MDVETVIDDKIQPQLIKAFGRQTANRLITQATMAYVSTDGDEEAKFESFVTAICSDPQVRDAWGERGTAERVEDWHTAFGEALASWQNAKGGEMSAKILDGRAMAKEARAEIIQEVEAFTETYGFAPTIAVVRAGDDPASVSYAKMIKRSFEGAGMGFVLHALPDTATTDDVIDVVAQLNADGNVHGIMVQEPLPRGVDEDEIKAAIRASKDAEDVVAGWRRNQRQAGRSRRAIQHCRPPHVLLAHAAPRHSEHVPLAHPPPGQRDPRRRHPVHGSRSSPSDQSRYGQARSGSH